jgi:hypothetical protein
MKLYKSGDVLFNDEEIVRHIRSDHDRKVSPRAVHLDRLPHRQSDGIAMGDSIPGRPNLVVFVDFRL